MMDNPNGKMHMKADKLMLLQYSIFYRGFV